MTSNIHKTLWSGSSNQIGSKEKGRQSVTSSTTFICHSSIMPNVNSINYKFITCVKSKTSYRHRGTATLAKLKAPLSFVNSLARYKAPLTQKPLNQEAFCWSMLQICMTNLNPLCDKMRNSRLCGILLK